MRSHITHECAKHPNEGYSLKKKTRRSYRNKSNLNPNSGRKPKKDKKKRYLENQKEKFRKSREWKEFRAKMAIKANHRDYITGKKLVKGFNVHHMKTNLTEESYCDISNESEFIPLNSQCHKLLHYIFTYYQKDKTIIDRLREILDKMCELKPDCEIPLNCGIDPIDQEDMEGCMEELGEIGEFDETDSSDSFLGDGNNLPS